MSLPPRARPATAGRLPSMPSAPLPSPAPTHRSVAAARKYAWTTRDTQSQINQAQSTQTSTHRAATPAAASTPSSAAASHRSQRPHDATSATSTPRTTYTGIRHLLAASDINTDGYIDSPSRRPEQAGGAIEHLFAGAGADGACSQEVLEGYVHALQTRVDTAHSWQT